MALPSRALAIVALAALASGCGGGASASPTISVQAAKSFAIAAFAPGGTISAGVPTTVSFQISQPSGQPLTTFKTGSGPHTGVHLIFVRRDLGAIVHLHPPIAADGTISTQVTLPSPGPWRMLVDVYANLAGQPPNFQLHRDLNITGGTTPAPPPSAFAPVVKTDGYTFTVDKAPVIKNAEPAVMAVHVAAPDGTPAVFEPWFGATAHAIFFHEGTLAYFHTHVCRPSDTTCAGVSAALGSSPAPGLLNVGILLPGSGTWRLFLQVQVAGKVLTAPFTLSVS
jgi:hypothetical protein